jgi:ABC-type sugar transport system permease subunit
VRFSRAPPGQRDKSLRLSPQKTGIILIAPAVILICGLLVYPVLYGVWLSLFKKHSFFPEQRFVGLANYAYLLKDSDFWRSLWYGTVYSVSTISLQIVIGIIAALILNEAFRGRNLVRGVVLFPYMIPTVVAIILWKWLLNDQFGLVNYLLFSAGIVENPVSWMGKDQIMTSLIIISVWEFFPFVVLSVLKAADNPARPLRGRQGGRRQGMEPLRSRDAPPAQERFICDHSASKHLDVYQIRHGLVAYPGRRR